MARKGTWRRRLDELERTVGRGVLAGQYAVDQRYAAYQHNTEGLRHPRGGGPHFVSVPLEARHREWFRGIADGLLRGQAPREMVSAMQDLDSQVRILAPVDENDLRRSGQYNVTDGGTPFARGGPEVARLTDEELRAKARRRGR